MNIKIDIDLTPEEMRRLMGLPDVQEFNREVMAQMFKKMQEGAEGFDPANFFNTSIANSNELFKPWMNLFTGMTGNKTTDKS